MEIHKDLRQIDNYEPNLNDSPTEYFEKSLVFVKEFYQDKLNYYLSLEFDKVVPDYFFSEYIWVVHATGFSAKAVGKMMPRLSKAYGPYHTLCNKTEKEMFKDVLPVCNHLAKARAVWETSKILSSEIKNSSWTQFRNEKLSSPQLLQKLPYIGKITCFHLARNIGILESVKPDLHLVRMANKWGFSDCNKMCEEIQEGHLEKSGEKLPLGIIDLVLWYAASTFGTKSIRNI